MEDAQAVADSPLAYFIHKVTKEEKAYLYEHVMQVATQRQLDLINKANEED